MHINTYGQLLYDINVCWGGKLDFLDVISMATGSGDVYDINRSIFLLIYFYVFWLGGQFENHSFSDR